MSDCPFCLQNKILRGEILLENKNTYLVASIDPVLAAAGMIIPKRHISTPFELSKDEWVDTFNLLIETKELFSKDHKPDGFNIGWNIGETAGQNEEHLHLHIICRFKDEPLAGKGIRYVFKQESNRRKSKL